MAFALWVENDLAWTQGLHEYRPMGTAVVARSDRFRPRDFDPARPAPPRHHASYAGLFPSLGAVNSHLAALGRSQPKRKKPRRRRTPTPAWI